MGRTARRGPAHKIKAYNARLWSACTARQSEDISTTKEDLFGYDRYRIPYKYLPYNQIDLALNRLVTLPPDYIRRAGTPSNSSHIQYNQPKTQDVGYYVDQTAWTCLNLVSCHHLAPDLAHLYDKSTIAGYHSVDCRASFVDSWRVPCSWLRAHLPINLSSWKTPSEDCRASFVDNGWRSDWRLI